MAGMKDTLVTWPTGNAYEGEEWAVVREGVRDVVIQNREGYRATVSKESVVVLYV